MILILLYWFDQCYGCYCFAHVSDMAPGTLVHIVSLKPKLSYRIKPIGPHMIIRILKLSPVMLNESENVCLIWRTGLLFIVIKSYHQCETVMSPFECDTIYLSRCYPLFIFWFGVITYLNKRYHVYMKKRDITLWVWINDIIYSIGYLLFKAVTDNMRCFAI